MKNSTMAALAADMFSFDEIARERTEQTVNRMLESDILDWLAQIALDEGDTPSRNGYYCRTVQTRVGRLELRIPRDRAGEYRNRVLKPYKRHSADLVDMVVRLYGRGMTMSELREFMSAICGASISESTIQRMVSLVYAEAEEFNSRPLGPHPVVFLDGTWLPVRRAVSDVGEYDRECVLVAVGFDAEGEKRVLGFRIVPYEGASVWEEFLRELKDRGLPDPALFVTDGLQGMPDAIGKVFPTSRHQLCLIHVRRSLERAVPRRHRAEIAADFEAIRHSESLEEARSRLREFCAKWRMYGVARRLESAGGLFTYMLFPKAVWRSICTNNVIEGLNSILKADLRKRRSLNSERGGIWLIAEICDSYGRTRKKRKIAGYWDMTDEELTSMGFER